MRKRISVIYIFLFFNFDTLNCRLYTSNCRLYTSNCRLYIKVYNRQIEVYNRQFNVSKLKNKKNVYVALIRFRKNAQSFDANIWLRHLEIRNALNVHPGKWHVKRTFINCAYSFWRRKVVLVGICKYMTFERIKWITFPRPRINSTLFITHDKIMHTCNQMYFVWYPRVQRTFHDAL